MCRKSGGIWRLRPVDVDSSPPGPLPMRPEPLRLRIFIRALIAPWTQHPQSRPFEKRQAFVREYITDPLTGLRETKAAVGMEPVTSEMVKILLEDYP